MNDAKYNQAVEYVMFFYEVDYEIAVTLYKTEITTYLNLLEAYRNP